MGEKRPAQGQEVKSSSLLHWSKLWVLRSSRSRGTNFHKYLIEIDKMSSTIVLQSDI